MCAKNQLRYKYKIKRKYFMHSAREVADGAIYDEFLQAFGDRDGFFVYNSFGSEADTRALIAKLLSLGKRVYLPRVEGKNIVPVPYHGGENELKEGAFGIEEPIGQAVQTGVEICVTPLLCVNQRGFRLGYGGGYYDRFFAANPNVLRVGIGYALQLCDDFAEESFDLRLDKFICERGIIDFGKRN